MAEMKALYRKQVKKNPAEESVNIFIRAQLVPMNFPKLKRKSITLFLLFIICNVVEVD